MSRDGYDWTMAYTENEAPGTVYLSYAGVSHDYVRKTSTIRKQSRRPISSTQPSQSK